MELPLTHEQEIELTRIAEHEGKTIATLLLDQASQLLRSEEEKWAAVDRALAQVERGEFIEEDEMDRRFAAMLARA
jgi:predicted transcriptional regulator